MTFRPSTSTVPSRIVFMEPGFPNPTGLYKDNGKENGNYYSILGLYRDNGIKMVLT